MARKLKVYRTPIGFDDAYVAAASQKAALTAWGADVDLFARGVAEAVSDDALTAEPLKTPGTVVRRSRGSNEEHMAALPKDPPKRKRPTRSEDGPPPKPRTASRAAKSEAKDTIPPKAKQRPSRARLDAAELALDHARADHEKAIAEIRRQEKELQQRRRDRETRYERDREALEARIAEARERYGAALEKWRG